MAVIRAWRYPVVMRKGLVVAALCVWMSFGAFALSSGSLGCQCADVYARFAPLATLHRSYGEHLFRGTAVEVPAGLIASCADFAVGLAMLQLELVTQTDSSADGVGSELIHLRSHVAEFCEAYREPLRLLDASPVVDPEVLEDASDAGLFPAIAEIDRRFERLLDAVLDALSGAEGRWRFAVAFTTRTLLAQDPPEWIGVDLVRIFCGGEETAAPPFPVSPETRTAMDALGMMAGRALSSDEALLTMELARTVLSEVAPGCSPEESK